MRESSHASPGRRKRRRTRLLCVFVLGVSSGAVPWMSSPAQAYTTADCPSTQAAYPVGNQRDGSRPVGDWELAWQGSGQQVWPCWRAHILDKSAGDGFCIEEVHDWGLSTSQGAHNHYDSRVIISCYAASWKHTKYLEREDDLNGGTFDENWAHIISMQLLADCKRDGPPFDSSNIRDTFGDCRIPPSGVGTLSHLAGVQSYPAQGDWTDFWIFGTGGVLTIFDQGDEFD
jgi:hypothetical protein